MEFTASIGHMKGSTVQTYIDCEILIDPDSFTKDEYELHEIGELPTVPDALQ